MDPYTRETVVERRQLVVHWGAVFAGALVGVGLWVPLEMFGTGLGFATIWTILVSITSLFAGGYAASRLSQSRDQTQATTHGLLAWSFASLFAAAIALAAMSFHHAVFVPNAEPDLAVALAPVNAHQQDIGKPAVTVGQIMEASRGLDPAHVDTSRLADRIASVTTLTRAEALDVAQHLNGDVIERATRLAIEADRADHAAYARAHALLGGGFALLFGLASALLGSVAALKHARLASDTAPYPVIRS